MVFFSTSGGPWVTQGWHARIWAHMRPPNLVAVGTMLPVTFFFEPTVMLARVQLSVQTYAVTSKMPTSKLHTAGSFCGICSHIARFKNV